MDLSLFPGQLSNPVDDYEVTKKCWCLMINPVTVMFGEQELEFELRLYFPSLQCKDLDSGLSS